MNRRARRSSRRALARVLVVLLGAALTGTAPTGYAPTGYAQPVPDASTGDVRMSEPAGPDSTKRETTVTLITGDQVHLRMTADGLTAAEVTPTPRSGGVVPQFYVSTRPGEVHVVPSDVQRLIPDRLDPELFNITGLVAQGLADGASDTVPVILSHQHQGGLARLDAMPTAGHVRHLTSVDASAVAFDKDQLDDVGAAITGLAHAVAGSDPRQSSDRLPAAAEPLAGVDKIWLDRAVQASLDRSTGQVSAPAAWQAGLDGAGVTVAVLDTGIDDTHPDLAGRVRAAADFVTPPRDEPDPVDRHGHGTHVASIIAGGGAASGGERQGVAPGAELLNGKVLDAAGFGTTSSVIAGMEWAASDQGADIVNMSLGGADNPLLDSALEQLSDEHDTLFVVAAGNEGCDGCITSPGAAPAALTVGAVDRDDQLASFSSRGPATGAASLKPDVTAPGVGIMAARAPSTASEDDPPYAAMSGTSMAAPHVAGAAAILSQAQPDLDREQVKAVLMGTAHPTAGLTRYEQGTGRIDVARALDTPVVASVASLDFGTFPHPRDGSDQSQRTVTYQNVSDQPVVLDLTMAMATAGGTPVEGLAMVSPARLTLAPGATGQADVVVDPAAVGTGRYAGLLLAEPAGGAPLRTPVGLHNERQYVDLRFDVTARDGRAGADAFVAWILNVETGETWGPDDRCSDLPWERDPCLRVPVGTYAALGLVSTHPEWWEQGDPRPVPPQPKHTALVGDAELVVAADMTLEMDARDAVEVQVTTPDDETKANLGAAAKLAWYRAPEAGAAAGFSVLNLPGSQLEERFFAQPMEPVTIGEFAAYTRWRLEAPHITLTVDSGVQPELNPQYYPDDFLGVPGQLMPRYQGTRELPLVDIGQGRSEDLVGVDLAGALALVRRSDDLPVAEQANRAAAAGAELVAVYNDEPGANQDPGRYALPVEVPTVRLSQREGIALIALLQEGPVDVTASGNRASPYAYDLVYTERGKIPADLRYRAESDALAQVNHDIFTQLGRPKGFHVDAHPFQPWDTVSYSSWRPFYDAPRSYVQYHVPDPALRWSHSVQTRTETVSGVYLQLSMTTDAVGYPTVDPHRLQWFPQPLVPAFHPSAPVQRWGNYLAVPRAQLASGGGQPVYIWLSGGGRGGPRGAEPARGHDEDGPLTASLRMWRQEELLLDSFAGGADGSWLPPVVVPEEEDTYRIVFEVDNHAPWSRLSSRTRTEWTFRSAGTDPSKPPVVAPLMTLRYDIPLDLFNSSLLPQERRGPPTITITAGHVPGAQASPIAGMRLWASFDGGQSWQERPGQPVGGSRFAFMVPDDEEATHVSLRVEAWDTAGNRIAQEVIRAYGITAR